MPSFLLSMNILITGGTGSLGSALTKKWINEGHNLTIISRDDHKQLAMRQVWPQIKFYSLDLGDAGAYRRLLDASEGQDYCIHCAIYFYKLCRNKLSRIRDCIQDAVIASRVNGSLSWLINQLSNLFRFLPSHVVAPSYR